MPESVNAVDHIKAFDSNDLVVVVEWALLSLLGRQFRAPLGRSLGPYSIPLTQKKLESGSNGSYCVAMCSIVLL